MRKEQPGLFVREVNCRAPDLIGLVFYEHRDFVVVLGGYHWGQNDGEQRRDCEHAQLWRKISLQRPTHGRAILSLHSLMR